jgi:hypothetical protein
MYRFVLFLVPALLCAGQVRYARFGQADGKVEIQLHAADPWLPAERNLPIGESAWLRTGASSRLEIELDEGSALRLGPDSLVEVSDYTRLSTGQRVTLLSLDRGLAYFTGEPQGRDALMLAVPGAQITLSHGARVRLEALETVSRISVIEGIVRISCPAAELDLREGQVVKVEPANAARFSLDREIAAMELDRWSEDRDRVLAAPASATHVRLRYGLADLDTAGEWLSTDIGDVWRPKVADGWAPFQKGRWRWYDTLGYTWISDDQWGWVPYHYGRWTRKNELGWVWVPPAQAIFKPGDVYWLWGKALAGWGPLAPGENWLPSDAPQQFLNVNTTYATLLADARVIDPAGFTARPKEPLGVAVFALALPSPAFPSSRLEAARPQLRVGATKAITPAVPDAAFQDAVPPPPAPPPMPPAVVNNPASDAPPVIQPGPPIDPGAQGPPPPPVIYPVPVYTGIVVINPPEHPDYSRRNPNRGNHGNNGNNAGKGTGSPQPPANPTPPAAPVPIRTQPVDTPHVGAPPPQRTDRPRLDAPPPRIERREQPHEGRPAPPTPAPAPAPPRIERREQPHEGRPAPPTPAPAPPPRSESRSESRSEIKAAPKPDSRSESKTDSTTRKQ